MPNPSSRQQSLDALRQSAIARFTQGRQESDVPTLLLIAALSSDNPAIVDPLVQQAHGLASSDPEHLARWAGWAVQARHPEVASSLSRLGLDWRLDAGPAPLQPLWSLVLSLDASTVLDRILRDGSMSGTDVLTGPKNQNPVDVWEPHRPWLAQALSRKAFACAERLWNEQDVRTDQESLDQALRSMVLDFQDDGVKATALEQKVNWMARLLQGGANPMRTFAQGKRVILNHGRVESRMATLNYQWKQPNEVWPSQADKNYTSVDQTLEHNWTLAHDLLHETFRNLEYYPEQGQALWSVLRDHVNWSHVQDLPCGAGLMAFAVQMTPYNAAYGATIPPIFLDLQKKGVALTTDHPVWNPVELALGRSFDYSFPTTPVFDLLEQGVPATPLKAAVVSHMIDLVEGFVGKERMFKTTYSEHRDARAILYHGKMLRALTPVLPEAMRHSWLTMLNEGEATETAWLVLDQDERAKQRDHVLEAHTLRLTLARADSQLTEVSPPRQRHRL